MTDFPIETHDILLRRELIAIGWNDRDIARSVRRGGLHKIRHGAYINSDRVTGFGDVQHARLRSRAVLRTVDPSSVLSHQSALLEYGVPLWGLDLADVHLTRTDRRHGRREAGQVHHRGPLDADLVTICSGVPVVTPARAAVEVILAATPEVGLIVLCGVLHEGLATLDEVAQVAARSVRWPHSLHARLVLARADARLAGVGEARTWHLFFDQQVPRPEPQVEVFSSTGALLGIVDFLWRRHRVFMEFDGAIKYTQHRLPGETLEQYLMREKRREESICAATGWVCIRISWADLGRPVATARRIKRLLDSRDLPAA